MSLDLYVDGPRWRAHLRSTADAYLGIIPVAKGNGYGFGIAGLARRTQWLGCDSIAVGTYREVEARSRTFASLAAVGPHATRTAITSSRPTGATPPAVACDRRSPRVV